jgi:hypothetical protein
MPLDLHKSIILPARVVFSAQKSDGKIVGTRILDISIESLS